MIRVTVYRSKEKTIQSFEISGHADSGPYGYDIVCAGVSAVSIGAVNAVLELCKIDLKIKQGEDGGYLYVALPEQIPSRKMEQVQLLFEGMMVSLKSIQLEYNEFIHIKEA